MAAVVIVFESAEIAHELASVGADELNRLVAVIGAQERRLLAQLGLLVELDRQVLLIYIDFMLSFAGRASQVALVRLGIAPAGRGRELRIAAVKADKVVAGKLAREPAVVVERLATGVAVLLIRHSIY